MSDRTHEFEVAGPPRVDVRLRSGDVVVRPSDGNTVTVVLRGNSETIDSTDVDATGDLISVRSQTTKKKWFTKTMDVVIAAPPGGVLRVNIGAGDVVVRLPLTSLDVNAGSGDVRVDAPTADIRVKVASGDLSVRGATSEAWIVSASGDIRLDDVRDVDVNSASGSIDVGRVSGKARLKSASGDVKLREFGGSEVNVATMSGDTTIGIVAARKVDATIKTLSGSFKNRIEASGEAPTGRISLDVKSFSGDVTLRSPW